MIHSLIFRLPYLTALLGVLLFWGCDSQTVNEPHIPKPYQGDTLRIHFAKAGADSGSPAAHITMPVSGTIYTIWQSPLLMETNLTNIDLVQLGSGKAIRLQYDMPGARTLNRATLDYPGQSLVLMHAQKPIGALVIDWISENGQLVIIPELPEAEMAKIVHNVRRAIKRTQ